jgi:uncharacterized protein YjbJ (UPF0337 family)
MREAQVEQVIPVIASSTLSAIRPPPTFTVAAATPAMTGAFLASALPEPLPSRRTPEEPDREARMDPLYKNIKGRLKEAAGALTGNDQLRAEGAADQAEAQVEDLAGAVTDKASELTDQAADKATGYWNQIKEAFDEGKDGK